VSWKHYNDIIGAMMDADGLTAEEARERYADLRADGLNASDIADLYHVDAAYESLDDWMEDYDEGAFDDDFAEEEMEGGVDT
jgi:hypothetical protein